MIPLKWLREFIVSIANLLEAEGRALRAGLVRVAVAIAGLAVAALLLFAAIGLLFAALIVALDTIMPTAWALAIGGVGCLLVAGGVAWAMIRHAR